MLIKSLELEDGMEGVQNTPKGKNEVVAKIIGWVIVIIIGIGITVVVNSQIDAAADKQAQEVLDVCTVDPDSGDCSDLKEKYDATVTCNATTCEVSVPVTHWYLIPVSTK